MQQFKTTNWKTYLHNKNDNWHLLHAWSTFLQLLVYRVALSREEECNNVCCFVCQSLPHIVTTSLLFRCGNCMRSNGDNHSHPIIRYSIKNSMNIYASNENINIILNLQHLDRGFEKYWQTLSVIGLLLTLLSLFTLSGKDFRWSSRDCVNPNLAISWNFDMIGILV